MRLFLIGIGHMLPEQVDVARALKKNHKIQYWVRMTSHFPVDGKEFPETVFHEYLDALKCVPAHGIDANKYELWSARDIAGFAAAESEFMTMADKLYPDWPVNRRKDLFYDMLRYWGGVLAQYAPEAIIMLSVPHGMYDFVLYRIARSRGIRTLILDDTVMDTNRFVLIEDYTKGNVSLAEALLSGRRLTLDELSPEMREYYLTMTRSKDPSPPAMKAFFETHTPLHNLRRLLKAGVAFIKDGTIIERAVMKLFKLMKRNLLDEHRQYQREADFKKPYVYFPLQYQPEATTSPLGGVFVDQLLAIKIISAALPKDWELYVKEHPAQIGVHGGNETAGRWRSFYKTIAAIPHARLVPINTNTFQLIDKAKTTATMTGTAAWEAIMRGKPAIVFGYPWFQNAPGILRAESVEDCRRAFGKIASGFKPEESEIIRYLSVLDAVSHKGSLYYVKNQAADWRVMHRAIEDALASFSTQSRQHRMARMKKQPFIEGVTVDLRPFGREHVTQEYINWFNDPEVTKYNRHGSTEYTLQLAQEYADEVQNSSNSSVFAIIAKDSGKHIGNISLQNIHPANQSAEYAIILGDKEYWGKGIAKEASHLILKHGFEELNLHRIYCGTSVKNIPMQKLAAALGFAQEGIRKDAMFKNGEFVDVIEYALLRPNYAAP